MAESYDVQDIQGPRLRLGSRGVPEKYYTIIAVSKGGTTFELDVVDGELDRERIAMDLAAKAQALDEIRSA